MTERTRRVVIVAYGAAPLLAETLAGLARYEQVTVVDNSSSPEVRAVAAAASAKYVDPGENLGFGSAVNVALRDLRGHAAGVDVLLLNPDAKISSAQIDSLQNIFDRSGNADVAAVSPALSSPEGVAQRVLWPFPSPAGMWRQALGLGRFGTSGQHFAVGAVLLLRSEALSDVGYFDERYFLYAEEADWQRRALDLGWRSVEVSEVTAVHVGAGTSLDSDRRDALFHAGQETYVRRWFGPMGWISYRLAALLGALVRAAVTTGARQHSAWTRFWLYLSGPRRRANVATPRAALRVTHVVVTGNAAGTERYVTEVATLEAVAGHQVTVVGGSEVYMRATLPAAVVWRRGETLARAVEALRAGGSQDVVHAHLASADLAAVLMAPWHGARTVSTRHIAKRRGRGRPAQLIFRLVQTRIDVEVCISEYVARAAGVRATVLTNGVRTDARNASAAARTVLLAQRLEPEKATDVALAGWAASGLAAQGWILAVCGEGSQLASLRRITEENGIAGVQWRGWVANLRTTMVDAGVLLAPAPGEPFGLAVVEAMSVALPVVAAGAGGHLETVGLCPQAVLFAPGDAAACGRQLAAVAAMTVEDRAGYGQALKQLQRNRFDVVEHVHRLDDIYRSVLR